MPPRRRKAAAPPSALQLARYGHVASLLRAQLKAKGWQIGDLNQALGKERHYAGSYHWLGAKGAPDPANRAKLAELFGIPETEFAMREAVPITKMAKQAAKDFEQLSGKPLPLAAPALPTPRPAPDVLQFAVTATGETRLKLDVVLPAEPGVRLLRMLLDQGLVVQPLSDALE
jgi:hypothetical protein